MDPEEQDQLDLEKAQQEQRARNAQQDRLVIQATPLPPQPKVADPAIEGGVRGALALTEEDNAENEVLINRLSVLAGQPKAALRALDPAELQRLAREQGVLFGTENAPTLRGKFTNPDFARSASDDVKALAEIEKQMLEARAKMAPPAVKPSDRIPARGNLARQEGIAGGTYAPGGVIPGGLPNPVEIGRATVAGVVGDLIVAGGGIIQSAAENTDEFFRSPTSPALAYLTDGKVRGEIPKDPNSLLSRTAAWAEGARQVGTDIGDFIAPEESGQMIRDSILSGARSAGQSLAWVAAAAVTGQPEIAIGGLTASTFGQKYGEYRDAGIAPFQAALGAGAQAGLEAATEALPFHLLIGDITNKTPFGEMLLKQLFTENATEQVATFTQDMVDWGMLNPDKTVGEFLAERPSAALQTAIATTMATLMQTSVAKGADAAAGFLDKSRQEEKREADLSTAGREAMKNLVAAAAESKTRERDPEQFRDFVDKLAQEGNVRAAYFSPEAFTRVAQTMGQTPDDLAVMFGVEGQVQAALASGAKIEVPLSVFLEKVGGLASADAILKDVTTSPFLLSEVEEAAIPEAARQRLLADADRVAQAAQGDAAFAAGVETVRANVEKSLTEAGRFVGMPNTLYSQLAASFYGNLAQQLGSTPEAMLQRFPLRVVGERITGGATGPAEAFVAQGEAFDKEGNQIRGRIGGTAEARSTGFNILDANPNTTLEQLKDQLGVSPRQASDVRKAWKESRGVPNNQKRKPGHPGEAYKQDQFTPLNELAVDDLSSIPEPLWNDHIKATKYAAYRLPTGIEEAFLPKGYVVVQSSAGNYAVREQHLKERMGTGEKFARMEQGDRGYYTPSTATIQLMAKADLSTFLHEIGHHFLELRFNVAKQLKERQTAGETLTTGEQELLDDVREWFRQAGIKPGNPGEGNALPQDVSWGLYFLDNILIDPTEAELKEFQKTQALAGKGPVVKLFKTTNGRVVAFPGNEYSHADARMLLEHNNKPSAQFKMRHATWDGRSLKFQNWYDTTGVLDDDGGKFAQEGIASLKEVGKLTPAERAEWYAAEVEEESTPRFNGRPRIKLSLRSDPALQYPDINIDIVPQVNRDGRAGVAVDLYFNGNIDRDRGTKATPEDLAKAQQVFARGIAALQAYAEKHRPDYIAFTPTSSRTESRSKLYDALLRRYPFGYEARITSEIDIVATETKTTKGRARRFLLVRPDIASEVPLELSNAEIKDGEWFGEPSVEKRRVITEIVQSGRSVPQPETGDTGGPGSSATDAGQSYAQGRPRQAVEVSDETIDRASKELNEKQFEAWKQAVAGVSNEDIAVSMGGENGDVTPAQVASWIFEAKGHGYPAPQQPRGLTISSQTMHVIAMSARGNSLSEIADAVYPDRSKDKAINLVKQIRFQRKNLIEQWKAHREGKFAQSAVKLQRRPPTIVGTGPNGRVLNRDLGQFLTDRHMKKYGRALDPNDPADYKIILKSMLEDYNEQATQTDTGEAWYSDDINEAVRVTSAVYPELQSDPDFRDLFLTVTALLSPQQKPAANWDNAIMALRSWKETGRIELTKPSGKMYGVLSHTNGLKMLQHLVDTLGLQEALTWVRTEHTGREMAEMRMASGIFAPTDPDTGKASTKVKDYLPSETNLTESKLGIYAFGPKVGDFMQNSVGIDQNAVTVDLWLTRTYNRYIGRLLDVAEEGAIASELRGRGERDNIKRLVRDAAAKAGLDPSAMQAALWYFEQRLFRNLGVKADSQNFSGAARAALGKRGLDVPVAESDQRLPSQEAGQSAGGRQEGQKERLGQGPVFYSALKRAVENAKQAKASATEWKAILKKAEGVKAEEIEWTGLFDWLDSGLTGFAAGIDDIEEAKKAPIPRANIITFLDGHGVKVEEVINSEAAAEARVQDRAQELKEEFGNNFLESGQYEPEYATAQYPEDLEDKKLAGRWYVTWPSQDESDVQDTYDTEDEAQEAADESNRTAEADAMAEAMAQHDFKAEARRDANYPEYEPHSLPGGENYTELLLTLPDIKGPTTHWGTPNVVAHVRFKTRRGPALPYEQRVALMEKVRVGLGAKTIGELGSGAIPRAAALGLLTAEEVEGLTPKTVLALEEIQSDWHQKGNAQGYRAPFDQAKLDEAQANMAAAFQRLRETKDQVLATQERAARMFAAEPFASILKKIDEPKDGLTAIIPLYDNLMSLVNRTPFQATGTFLEQVAGDVFSERMFAKLPQEQQDAARAAVADMEDARDAEQNAWLRANEAEIARNNARSPRGIPEAPFKDTKAWTALVLKRMVRYAAVNGFDQLAWIPGTVKNGDVVEDSRANSVTLVAEGDGGFEVVEYQVNGVDKPYLTNTDMTPENILGKEVAKRLREQPTETDERGRQVKRLNEAAVIHNQPGWEFYDIIVPSVANALGKKYGASVQMGAGLGVPIDDATVSAAKTTVVLHTLPITPELKAAALDGMPLFQPEQDGPPSGNPLSAEEKAFFARAMRELPPGSDEIDMWDAMSFREREPYHELWARQVESYFFEGKAPTPKLKRMFDKFREWLLNVYQSIVNLNAPLSDEVRGIMDRMLASKQEIADAERNHALQPMFATKPDAMSDQEWADYQSINQQATADAEKNLTQRSLRDVKWLSNARSREMRRLQSEAREQRKAMGAEVAAEVMAKPVNVARTFFSRGQNRDGTKVDDYIAVFDKEGQLVSGKPKLSISALEAMYPEGSGTDWRALGYGQYGMLSKDGLHPDALAGMFGYESGDALVRELLTAEPAADEIKGVTDQRMLERYGDLTDEASIARAADEAVYSSLRGKVLAAEYAALSAALGERKLLNEAAKTAAETLVRRLNASKLNANKFLAAERNAGRAAEAALRKNDLAGAAAAKKDQLLSFYIAKEVMAKQKEYDKAKLKFKQIIDAKRDTVSKSRNFDLVQASRAILAAYGMATMKHKPMEYMGAVKRYDPTLYSNLEPTLLNALTSGQKLGDLTVEQFFGLRDVVVQLWDLSREEKLVEINGQKMALKDVTDELNLHMEALGADPNKPITQAPTPAQRTLRLLEGAAASLRRVEAWARLMDKGTVGPFTKFVWRPVSQAATRYRLDQTRYILKFRELFAPIEKDLGNARIAATELGYTFANKAELLHAILHTGNASNQRKLLMGYRWAQERADGTMDTTRWDTFLARMAREGTLTAEDYQFAQSVWDLLEETKPLAQEAHRRVFGRYFAEITADVVHTPFGDFKGGYVPAIYDDHHNTDVALKRGQDAVEGNDSSMFPSPSKGFTEARVEYNRPMQLDVRLLAGHLDKVLKFAHMASPVRDVLRILRSPGVERHLHDLHPTAVEDMLLPWLVRSARQTNEAPIGGKAGRAVTNFANGLRRRSNMGLMFGNLVNVLQQPTGLFNAFTYKGVKKRYVGQAMARFLRDPAGIHAAVRALSPLIETRSEQQAIAMRDTLDTIVAPTGKFEQAAAWFERHTYFMQTALQNQQDVVVWLGAYESAKSRNETEAEAAQFADGVIRQTQGSSTPEDISRFETGTGWQKILVSMYGYFNMWGNQLSTEFRLAAQDQGLKKNKGRLLYVYVAGFMAPALLAQLIADAIRGDLPDDEDEGLSEWLAWFFGTQAKTAAAMVPIVGASVIAGVNAFNDKPYDDRVLSSPAVSAVETLVRVPKNFVDYLGGEGDLSRTTKDSLSLLTLMTGLPFQALGRPLGYLADVLEGDTEPKDAVDVARGMVAGR